MGQVLLTPQLVSRAVASLVPTIATRLRPDCLEMLRRARHAETHPRGGLVLDQLEENARIAEEGHLPLCQDTGTVWVRLEIGPDIMVPGDVFSLVDNAVASTWGYAHLRNSVVFDALVDRDNTRDNTPAFCDIDFTDEAGARLSVLLKGGGSDNASRVVMLAPGAGWDGIEESVVACVTEKAANACPPLFLGIGVGSTFDHVGGLAKRALLRPMTPDGAHADPRIAEYEQRLLDAVNETHIGPAGLGGDCTALAVRIETAPCHIAALPLAVNMGCSAMRSATIPLVDADGHIVLGGE